MDFNLILWKSLTGVLCQYQRGSSKLMGVLSDRDRDILSNVSEGCKTYKGHKFEGEVESLIKGMAPFIIASNHRSLQDGNGRINCGKFHQLERFYSP